MFLSREKSRELFLFEAATCWPQGRIHLFIFGLILLYYKNEIAIYISTSPWGPLVRLTQKKMALIDPPEPIPQYHS